MSKCKVGIIFGGVSSEHEVSLKSASSVIRNIPRDKYDTVLIGITKDGRWLEYGGPVEAIEDGSWHESKSCVPAFISPDCSIHGLVKTNSDGSFETERLDAVFPVLHGRNGEDGTIQGLFTLAGIPYVGCDLLSSAVCMDKAVTNAMLDYFGIPRAPWAMVLKYDIDKFELLADTWETSLGYPMFVKPANAGSSVGITKAHDRSELRAALDLAFEHDVKAVVEKNISGKELECSVLGNLEPEVSVVGEILSANEFYDYEAKYFNAQSRTIIPARITGEQQRYIQKIALEAYKALGCSGLSRIDFLMDGETGAIYLNEPNTIPGFTSISMYAKMWEASGIGYSELIDRLFRLAIERG
ncbi:MAG: D-alanine--D-alanine ligase family protein [Oscillospiraceae bacterium]